MEVSSRAEQFSGSGSDDYDANLRALPCWNAMSHAADREGELVRQARLGVVLARALIEHICRMQAAGYDNELVVDGELWNVGVRRKQRVS